jgi:molybdopterin-guanine dinucleotide biosynthesis protein A
MKFSAAVLAGGRSTRMGADKAFLRIGDEPLIERQLRCLREAGADELLVSGRVGVDYSCFRGKLVYDEHPDAGPLAGIAAVLKAASFPLVLVLAVDMPAMTPEMLMRIVSRCEECSGCVPAQPQRFQPLAAAYPTTLIEPAEHLLKEGRYSMQGFVAAAVQRGLVKQLPLDPSEQPCFFNWNEPSDWPPFAG